MRDEFGAYLRSRRERVRPQDGRAVLGGPPAHAGPASRGARAAGGGQRRLRRPARAGPGAPVGERARGAGAGTAVEPRRARGAVHAGPPAAGRGRRASRRPRRARRDGGRRGGARRRLGRYGRWLAAARAGADRRGGRAAARVRARCDPRPAGVEFRRGATVRRGSTGCRTSRGSSSPTPATERDSSRPAQVEAEAAGALRLGLTREPANDRLRALVAELLDASPVFAALWAAQDVRDKTHGRKAFTIPRWVRSSSSGSG